MLDMNHQMGIGYQEAKNLRVAEGFKKSKIESKGNESYLIYFGRDEIICLVLPTPYVTSPYVTSPFISSHHLSTQTRSLHFFVFSEIVLHQYRAYHLLVVDSGVLLIVVAIVVVFAQFQGQP